MRKTLARRDELAAVETALLTGSKGIELKVTYRQPPLLLLIFQTSTEPISGLWNSAADPHLIETNFVFCEYGTSG